MHKPVLKNKVLELFNPKPNENFIDATLGFAGHSKLILDKIAPNGKVLGIEIDRQVCEQVRQENIPRLLVANSSYINIKKTSKSLCLWLRSVQKKKQR